MKVNKVYMDMIRESGVRVTEQRLMVIDYLSKFKNKILTTEEIFEAISKEHPAIGPATVYRSLMLLTKIKIVNRVMLDDGVARYALNNLSELNKINRRHQLCCTNCNKVLLYDKDLLADNISLVENDTNFKINEYEIKFYGLCNKCKKKGHNK